MLIATFSLPAEAVALEHTLDEHPEIAIEAEQIAAHSTEWTMPCLWVNSDDFEAADETLLDDPSIDGIIEASEFADEKYYHIDWAETVEERIDAYIDQEGSILNAETTANGWKLQFRFVSRDQFDTFRETLSERGHSFELLDLTEPGAPRISTQGLTPDQREALLAARERGYFKVPREITARELAAELDMSHQSLSELLRRGTEKLVDSSLTTEGDGS